jgi:proteasome accessory factor B
VLLGAPRALTGTEIRERVPAYPDDLDSYKRAFERDKDDLREMGVPLLVEPVPGADPPVLGYRIRTQDYELRDPGLEPDELEALNLAAAVIGGSGGAGERALFKLGGTAVAEPRAEVPTDPDLVAAFSGVAERRLLRFRYHDVERRVDPYRLQFVRGRWYLNGFDHVRDEDRWYRMDRVEGSVEATGGAAAFERPETAVPGLQLDPWVVGGGAAATTAEVWFDPQVAATVRGQTEAGEVLRDDDDGLVVAISVTNREGFRSWLATFLDRAEVLAPADLRAEVVAWLEGLAAGVGR